MPQHTVSESGVERSELVVHAAAASLLQARAMAESLDRERYCAPCGRLFGSTIGQHMRHALDHFAAALGAVGGGEIDYDHRDRGTRVETDPLAAAEEIALLAARLDGLSGAEVGSAVRVRIMVDAEGSEALLGSTFARELAFAVHHATHHHAMIASIAGEMGVETPAGFGKAPSTAHHERTALGGR